MAKQEKEKIIIGNWKMNLTIPESTILAERLKKEIMFTEGVETVVAPSFVSLYSVSKTLYDSPIELSAQNVFYEENGAFTGEVSPLMLRTLVKYCIVGHSERRVHFFESDKEIAKKVKSLLSFGIKPIICIGESLTEKNDGLSRVVAVSQIEGALKFVSKEDLENIVIAYEPIWAIGSGKACGAKDAEYVIKALKKFLFALYGEKSANKVRIIYGASVTLNVVDDFLKNGFDGFLVGGASLDHEDFTDIVRQTYKFVVNPKSEFRNSKEIQNLKK